MPIIAKNDYLIDEILKNDKYRIEKDGTCWIVDQTTKTWRRWDRLHRTSKKNSKYRTVSYCGTKIQAHRLVYAKHKGKLYATLTINHIDGNPSNNHPENLELITQKENNLHSYRVLNKKPVVGYSKISSPIARMIRQQRKLGATYAELMSMFGLCKSTISYVVNKRTWN